MPWTYDPRAARYRDTITGRFVSEADLPGIVDSDIDSIIAEVESLASALTRGDIRIDAWFESVRMQIKDAYSTQAILAAGGLEQMTPEYWGVVGGRIWRQYRYLNNFAEQLAAGRLTEGQIVRRSRMYINSARQTYWAIKTREVHKRGFTEERWIAIGDANTCSPCFDAGVMGWQPLGTFAEPGSGTVLTGGSFCEGLTSCRCQKEYR